MCAEGRVPGTPRNQSIVRSEAELNPDCYPVTAVPHVSPLFRDYVSGNWEKLHPFYPESCRQRWPVDEESSANGSGATQAIVELLRQQNRKFGSGSETQSNLDRLAQEPRPSSPVSRWRCSAAR